MLKRAEKLKESEWELQFHATLRELVARVPFLNLVSLKREVKLGKGGIGRPDWLTELRVEDQSWTLVVEGKKSGQPREVRSAILQLKHFLSLLPPDKLSYGLVLAPFISEESARICAEAGVGYADCVGNARLSFDRIFIETRVEGNSLSVKRETKSVFSPKATRVLRVLLQGPLRAWKVKDLAAAADVSLGHVSAVRQQLLAREWAEEEEGGLRIIKPDALLEAWAVADDWEKRTETREYSLLEFDPAKVAAQLEETLGGKKHAFTQWFGAFLRQPYTLPIVTSVYVEDFPDEGLLKNKLQARRVEGGGRLRIVKPKDEGVFLYTQEIRGRQVVCDVQLYLDVIRAGLRGDEAAQELRGSENFSGGWQ
jgi:hypothetical protein